MIGGRVHHSRRAAAVSNRYRRPHVSRHRQGFRRLGRSFTITDEWYALKNFADDLHVILVQVTEGMKGHMYERPNFPITWARAYGKGRVFYTSMGHREDVWENPMYQALLAGRSRLGDRPHRGQRRAQHPPGHAQVRRAAEVKPIRSEPAAANSPAVGSRSSLTSSRNRRRPLHR